MVGKPIEVFIHTCACSIQFRCLLTRGLIKIHSLEFRVTRWGGKLIALPITITVSRVQGPIFASASSETC